MASASSRELIRPICWMKRTPSQSGSICFQASFFSVQCFMPATVKTTASHHSWRMIKAYGLRIYHLEGSSRLKWANKDLHPITPNNQVSILWCSRNSWVTMQCGKFPITRRQPAKHPNRSKWRSSSFLTSPKLSKCRARNQRWQSSQHLATASSGISSQCLTKGQAAASDSHPPCFGGKAFVQSPWASQIVGQTSSCFGGKKANPRNLLLWKCQTKRWKWSCQRTRAKRAFLVMNGWFGVFNSWLWSKLCLYLLYLCQCPAVLLVWPLLDCWMRLFLSITGSGVDAFQSSTYLRHGRNIKRSIEAPAGLSMIILWRSHHQWLWCSLRNRIWQVEILG